MRKLIVFLTICVVALSMASYGVLQAAENGTTNGSAKNGNGNGKSISKSNGNQFVIDDSGLTGDKPCVKIYAVGTFSSKSEIDDGMLAKIEEAKRKYGAAWKEVSSEIRRDGKAIREDTGQPLNNIKIYYVEARYPAEGEVIARTTPKNGNGNGKGVRNGNNRNGNNGNNGNGNRNQRRAP